MPELKVNTCSVRGAAHDVWGLSQQVQGESVGLGPAASATLPALGDAVACAELAYGVERLREVMAPLAGGLRLLAVGLEQSAEWYEAAEIRATEQARATGVPLGPVYGPPPVGPVSQLQSLNPVYGPPSGPAAAAGGTP